MKATLHSHTAKQKKTEKNKKQKKIQSYILQSCHYCITLRKVYLGSKLQHSEIQQKLDFLVLGLVFIGVTKKLI